MVIELKRQPSVGAALGQGLGEGLSTGLQYLTNRKIKQMEEEQESLQNERAMKEGVYNGFTKFSPRFQDALLKEAIAKNALTDLLDRSSPEQRKEIEQRIVNDPSLLSNIQQGEQPQQQPQIAQMPQRGGLGALLQNQQQPQQAPIAQQFAKMGSKAPFQQQQMPLAQQFASMGAYHPRDEFPAPQAPQVMAPSQQEQPQYQGQVAGNITPRQTPGAPQGAQQQQQLEPARAETREEAFKRKLAMPKPVSADTQFRATEKEKTEARTRQSTSENQFKKQANDLFTQAESRLKVGEENSTALRNLITLSKSGKIVSGQTRALLQKFGLENMLTTPQTDLASKESARLVANSMGGLLQGGGRVTNVMIDNLTRAMPSLANTPKGIEMIGENLLLAEKEKKIEFEALREAYRDYKNSGGTDMIELRDKARLAAEPKMNKLRYEMNDNVFKAIGKKPVSYNEFNKSIQTLPPANEVQGKTYEDGELGMKVQSTGNEYVRVL